MISGEEEGFLLGGTSIGIESGGGLFSIGGLLSLLMAMTGVSTAFTTGFSDNFGAAGFSTGFTAGFS
jgi:hypothetical protein